MKILSIGGKISIHIHLSYFFQYIQPEAYFHSEVFYNFVPIN